MLTNIPSGTLRIDIDSGEIVDGTIQNVYVADNAINSAKIADGTVDKADLAGNAVDSAKIGYGTIVDADISNTTKIAASKVQNGNLFINSAGTDGQEWKSDGIGRGKWGTDQTGGGGGLWTATGNDIHDNNTGNVGIRTSSPRSLLDIRHTSTGGLNIVGDGDLDNSYLLLGEVETGVSANDRFFKIQYNGTPNSLDFLQEAGLGLKSIMSLRDGKLGNGTSAPGAPLEVNNINSHIKFTGAGTSGVVQVSSSKIFLGQWDTGGDVSIDLNTGKVGIRGSVQMGNDTTVCNSSTAGTVKFNGTYLKAVTGQRGWPCLLLLTLHRRIAAR